MRLQGLLLALGLSLAICALQFLKILKAAVGYFYLETLYRDEFVLDGLVDLFWASVFALYLAYALLVAAVRNSRTAQVWGVACLALSASLTLISLFPDESARGPLFPEGLYIIISVVDPLSRAVLLLSLSHLLSFALSGWVDRTRKDIRIRVDRWFSLFCYALMCVFLLSLHTTEYYRDILWSEAVLGSGFFSLGTIALASRLLFACSIIATCSRLGKKGALASGILLAAAFGGADLYCSSLAY